MGPETNHAAKGRRQDQSRIGLLLAMITLFWSARLLGREDALGSSQPEVRQEAAPQHVLVVNIAERKLVVMRADHVLKAYAVAVGKPSTPSPTGKMRIINKVVDPTYYHQGKVIPPGESNPLGDRDGPERKRLRHSRDQRPGLYRQGSLARLHSHGKA